MAGLKYVFHDSLHMTMWDALGVRQQVVEHVRRFCLNAIISSKALDLFYYDLEVTQGGGLGTSASDSSA